MLLSLVLMFTLLVPAMAVEVEQQRENEETITVMSDGHGQYSLLQDRDDRMQGTLSINQEVISAYATEDAGIYYVNGVRASSRSKLLHELTQTEQHYLYKN